MQHLILKVVNRFKFELKRQYDYLFAEVRFKVQKKKIPKITVLSTEETIKYIIDKKVSISRFGDGELHWILKFPQDSFQENSDTLTKRLEEVLTSNLDNLLICIPDVFEDLSMYKKSSRKFWRVYMDKHRANWNIYLNSKQKYGNSLITRPYMSYRERKEASLRFELIKKIWKNKDITIIEGNKSFLGVGNDLFKEAASLERIICPSINAFEKYNEILNEAKKVRKENIILIALGPTATILSYDLSKIGYQALDIGHLDIEYEWYLKKARNKTVIEGKYVNETGKKWIESKDKNFIDQQYINSILHRIE
ncbi:hypothetical protein G159_16290 [Planococcus glaciei CHR43]|uniref:SP_1767 family glycosyltransferase n=1 Tax=Planococcus glaciei TaxID=459472 RepID=UPI0003DF09BB|nr:SP_1767 family glycosyltransferase [Planococcus glaciei]ETP67658.1 hypothetical protein G159_16290 [Planococcus glaciei CHR43]